MNEQESQNYPKSRKPNLDSCNYTRERGQLPSVNYDTGAKTNRAFNPSKITITELDCPQCRVREPIFNNIIELVNNTEGNMVSKEELKKLMDDYLNM